MNAATHGVFCKNPVLPGERRSECVAFRNLLLDGWNYPSRISTCTPSGASAGWAPLRR